MVNVQDAPWNLRGDPRDRDLIEECLRTLHFFPICPEEPTLTVWARHNNPNSEYIGHYLDDLQLISENPGQLIAEIHTTYAAIVSRRLPFPTRPSPDSSTSSQPSGLSHLPDGESSPVLTNSDDEEGNEENEMEDDDSSDDDDSIGIGERVHNPNDFIRSAMRRVYTDASLHRWESAIEEEVARLGFHAVWEPVRNTRGIHWATRSSGERPDIVLERGMMAERVRWIAERYGIDCPHLQDMRDDVSNFSGNPRYLPSTGSSHFRETQARTFGSVGEGSLREILRMTLNEARSREPTHPVWMPVNRARNRETIEMERVIDMEEEEDDTNGFATDITNQTDSTQ